MCNRRPLIWLSFSVFTFLTIIGCTTSFEPLPLAEVNFQERAQIQVDGNFRVTAAVLSADETKALFGFALYKKGIQPIWLEIENKSAEPTWFLPFSVDPDYFPPLEVTYPYHLTFSNGYNDRLDRYFLDVVRRIKRGSSRGIR